MRKREIRDGLALCRYHHEWHPVEDFDLYRQVMNGSVHQYPMPDCRLARQTLRDDGKQADPARAAIEGRSKTLAGHLSKSLGISVSYKWVWIELNYRALVPIMRAMLGPDGLCLNCGRHQDGPRQLHIEHRYPPLFLTDWPAQHARNLWIACAGCNVKKGSLDGGRQWLEQEHRKWMIDREWSTHAGTPGWPSLDPAWPMVDGPGWPEGTLFHIA